MPNWCANVVELQATTPETQEYLAKLFNASEEHEFLGFVHPVPEELTNTVKGWLGDEQEQKELELKQKENLSKFGYKTWYEFCCNEWGTKWEAHDISANYVFSPEKSTLTLSFDTAWSPPIPIYGKLIEKGLEVQATYCEQGGAFMGVYKNGEIYEEEFDTGYNYETDEYEESNLIPFLESHGLSHLEPTNFGG